MFYRSFALLDGNVRETGLDQHEIAYLRRLKSERLQPVFIVKSIIRKLKRNPVVFREGVVVLEQAFSVLRRVRLDSEMILSKKKEAALRDLIARVRPQAIALYQETRRNDILQFGRRQLAKAREQGAQYGLISLLVHFPMFFRFEGEDIWRMASFGLGRPISIEAFGTTENELQQLAKSIIDGITDQESITRITRMVRGRMSFEWETLRYLPRFLPTEFIRKYFS
jgi:hypothetical protein